MFNQNQEENKYQERINHKTINTKLSKIREDLIRRNLGEKKANILTSGINNKEDLFNRQKKLRRINNDISARKITNNITSDLINNEYKRILKNSD